MKKRRGGRPVYTPETSQRRAQGRITLGLSPEDAAALRRLGAERPGGGGMAGIVSEWLRAGGPDDGRELLQEALAEGPVLLTLDAHGDVILRLLRKPAPSCGVVAEGSGPGLHEALLGLRRR